MPKNLGFSMENDFMKLKTPILKIDFRNIQYLFAALFIPLFLSACGPSGDPSYYVPGIYTPQLMGQVGGDNSCKVWYPASSGLGMRQTGSWSGECANGLAEGVGTLGFHNYASDGSIDPSTYLTETGTFHAGMPEGDISINYSYNGNYVGVLHFKDGQVNGPGSITVDEGYGQTVLDKSDSFDGTLDDPTMEGQCSSNRNFPEAHEEIKGICQQYGTNGSGVFSIGYTGKLSGASIYTSNSGSWSASGDFTGGNLVHGTLTVYDSNSSKIKSISSGNFWKENLTDGSYEIYDDNTSRDILYKGTFSPGPQLTSGTETIKSLSGRLLHIEQGTYTAVNGKYYLQGNGAVAGPSGKLVQGTWTDGCLNGKYPEDGFADCKTALASANSDRSQDAQAAALAEQQRQEQQAEEQQQQAEQQQEEEEQQERQAQVNQQIAGMIAGGIAQSVGQFSQAQQNIAQIHEQVQQEIAARNEQAAPAPIYTPPPAPVISPPQTDSSSDQQVASDGSSGADTVPVAESCVSSFYDPNMYNWFTWKDNCSYPVNVYFRLQNNTAGYGTDNVIPGNNASGNTGQGKNDIAQGGGWVWGACPQGYGAFDYATNQRWLPSTTQYYCKRTSTGG